MSESNQEGYRSLGWIINESEQGLFLVIADENMQSEIFRIYKQGTVAIYDCRQHPGAYFFRDLQEWVNGLPEAKNFMVVNFHMALQDEESIRRLNFSRDMLDRLEKNMIFFVTPYMDDQLANRAYDFYSFLKLRITFHGYKVNDAEKTTFAAVEDETDKEEWKPEDFKQKMAEANAWIEQVQEEMNQAHYALGEQLLLKASKIKERLLGAEHLEMAEIYHELAEVCRRQAKYREAEELCKKSLGIKEKILGEEHPDTAAVYNNLANVYLDEGRYREAEELYEKSLQICKKILGEEHPNTATDYNNLANLYDCQGKYQEAEKLHEKTLQLRRKILGEEHLDTARSYHNLACLYEEQGRYEMALNYFFRSYHIRLFCLGDIHLDTRVDYDGMKRAYLKCNPEGSFDQWLEEQMKTYTTKNDTRNC